MARDINLLIMGNERQPQFVKGKKYIMIRLILPVLLVFTIVFGGCRKSMPDCYNNNPLEELEWLRQKKEQLSSCVCLTQIIESRYEGNTVFEVKLVDPKCDGINIVYRCDGSVLTDSGSQAAYQSYLSGKRSSKIIWACPNTK